MKKEATDTKSIDHIKRLNVIATRQTRTLTDRPLTQLDGVKA